MTTDNSNNAHLSIPPVLIGVPLAEARGVAVLVHGRDQDERVMLDLARRLRLPDLAYVLPIAAGRSWYPNRYFDPAAESAPYVEDALEAVEAHVAAAIRDAAPDAGLVLCGFSQGACLVAELVARRPPAALAGVAILTGSLIGSPPERRVQARVDGLQMFCSCPRHDQWVALEDARSTAQAFQQAGARVAFEVLGDRDHLISDRAVAGVRSLLRAELLHDRSTR